MIPALGQRLSNQLHVPFLDVHRSRDLFKYGESHGWELYTSCESPGSTSGMVLHIRQGLFGHCLRQIQSPIYREPSGSMMGERKTIISKFLLSLPTEACVEIYKAVLTTSCVLRS